MIKCIKNYLKPYWPFILIGIMGTTLLWVFFTWYAGVGYGIASIIGLLLLRYSRFD